MKSCLRCIHFEPRTRFCRIDPPIPINEGDHTKSKWPVIMRPESDFCGRFMPKAEFSPLNNNQSSDGLHEMEIIKG